MKRRIRNAWLGALYLLAACTGCGTTIPQKPIADARALVDSTDPHVVAADAGLVAIRPVLVAACTGPAPLLDAARCEPALKGYDAAVEGLRGAQDILIAVDAALAVLGAVAEAGQ